VRSGVRASNLNKDFRCHLEPRDLVSTSNKYSQPLLSIILKKQGRSRRRFGLSNAESRRPHHLQYGAIDTAVLAPSCALCPGGKLESRLAYSHVSGFLLGLRAVLGPFVRFFRGSRVSAAAMTLLGSLGQIVQLKDISNRAGLI